MLNIPNKLISASCKLAENSVCSVFGLMPILLGNVVAMDRSNFYTNIWKSHLI